MERETQKILMLFCGFIAFIMLMIFFVQTVSETEHIPQVLALGSFMILITIIFLIGLHTPLEPDVKEEKIKTELIE